MKDSLKHTVCVVLSLFPLIYLAIVWNSLPETVAVHFDIHMQPDRYGSRAELVIGPAVISIVSLLVYLLMQNIHKIDPKRAPAGKRPPVFDKLSIGLVLFMSALGVLIVLSAQYTDELTIRAVVPLLGLLFAFLGNVMYSIKPNYFAGIRVPWTLNDETNWKKTHRLAGKLWFVGGVVIAIAGLTLSPEVGTIVLLAVSGILVVIPIAYSYKLFKQGNKTSL